MSDAIEGNSAGEELSSNFNNQSLMQGTTLVLFLILLALAHTKVNQNQSNWENQKNLEKMQLKIDALESALS